MTKYEPIEPTAEEMRTFASRFSKDEWSKLCENKIFLDLIYTDIKRTRILAEMLLAGKKIKNLKQIPFPKE